MESIAIHYLSTCCLRISLALKNRQINIKIFVGNKTETKTNRINQFHELNELKIKNRLNLAVVNDGRLHDLNHSKTP